MRVLKVLFFGIVIRPLVLIALGLNVVNRQLLPRSGPAIVAANHNSHLDTLVLMSLFPLLKLHQIRPVAAADYFLSKQATRLVFVERDRDYPAGSLRSHGYRAAVQAVPGGAGAESHPDTLS